MRICVTIGMLMATTVAAHAGVDVVPEIDALSGLAVSGTRMQSYNQPPALNLMPPWWPRHEAHLHL